MIASCLRIAAWRALLLVLFAGSAFAAPRLERERCTFKPPRGDKIECYTLIVPENRANPKGRGGAAESGGAEGQAPARAPIR